MKQFFKMMFASALGVFVAIGLLMLVGLVMMIGMVSSMGSSEKAYVPKADEKVLRLSLNGTVNETSTSSPFSALFDQKESQSLQDIQTAIEVAKTTDNIKGIYIDAAMMSAGTPSIDVIRRALIDFKESGKFIVAYADNYLQRCYYLSSVADKVFMNPQGMLELTGVASQVTFYKGLMKKVGVEPMIFKVGTYKGAVEPFMLDKLSDANREQITSYQQGIWKGIVSGIASARHISEDAVNRFADEGGFFAAAEKAVECGLVDELKYREDAEAYVKELAGIDSDKKLKMASVGKLKTAKKKPKAKKDKIAVIYAEGEIVSDIQGSLYGNEASITEKLSDELIKLKKDEEVKAIVLRVNSPGGSAYVSEQIWKQVNEIKKDKKIVVSMGDVAASGGYYISCAADKIVCEPNTLTGSIGVFGILPNMSELFGKLDVTTDVVKTNKFSDFGDVSRPWTEEEKALMQAHIERTYDTFLTRCADGRGMSKADIDNVGQGRVWIGEQALEKGLVDELGDLNRAIEVAAELAGLTEYSVKNVMANVDPFTQFLEKQLEDLKMSILRETLGNEVEMFEDIRRIKNAFGVQARLPFDLKPY